MGVLRVIVGPVCVAAMLLISPIAAGQVTVLPIESFPCPHQDGLIVNQLRIDITGSLGGQQLFMELDSGSVFNVPTGGGIFPPPPPFLPIFPELECDSFVAPSSALVVGGAVNIEGAPMVQEFGPDGISVAWAPAPGENIADETGFLVAQITLSEDASGEWSYFGATLSSFSPTIVVDLPIRDGYMLIPIPEPAVGVLLAVGAATLPRRR